MPQLPRPWTVTHATLTTTDDGTVKVAAVLKATGPEAVLEATRLVGVDDVEARFGEKDAVAVLVTGYAAKVGTDNAVEVALKVATGRDITRAMGRQVELRELQAALPKAERGAR